MRAARRRGPDASSCCDPLFPHPLSCTALLFRCLVFLMLFYSQHVCKFSGRGSGSPVRYCVCRRRLPPLPLLFPIVGCTLFRQIFRTGPYENIKFSSADGHVGRLEPAGLASPGTASAAHSVTMAAVPPRAWGL